MGGGRGGEKKGGVRWLEVCLRRTRGGGEKGKRRRRGSTPFKRTRRGGGQPPEGATRWQGVGEGRGGRGSAAVGRRGVAGTSLEPVGAGGRSTPVQNRGGGGGCQVGPRHCNGQRGLKLI
jgi:hypothetical protein